MNEKTKITLSPKQETLLIPLYAQAQTGNPRVFDPPSPGCPQPGGLQYHPAACSHHEDHKEIDNNAQNLPVR